MLLCGLPGEAVSRDGPGRHGQAKHAGAPQARNQHFLWKYGLEVATELGQISCGVRQLVKDGCWCVPPAERPAGWEKMGVREPGAP